MSDLEPKMVEHLTKRAAVEKLANIRAVQASASSPNLPEPVDVVLVVDTYHHIPNRPAYFAALKVRRKTSASHPSRSGARWRGPASCSTARTTSCRDSSSSCTACSRALITLRDDTQRPRVSAPF